MCERNTTDPGCPECGAIDCEKAHRLDRPCSSGYEPGGARVCEKCGRLDCQDRDDSDIEEQVRLRVEWLLNMDRLKAEEVARVEFEKMVSGNQTR